MTYDPRPKKKRKAIITLILAFLGLGTIEELPQAIAAQLTWQTPQDILRGLQTQFLMDSGITQYKDWMIEDQNACDLCKYYAASGPYEISVAGPESHPNCRCYWIPHLGD